MRRILFFALLLMMVFALPALAQHGECTDHDQHDGSPSGEGQESSCQTVQSDDGNEESCYHEERNAVTNRVRTGVYIWETMGGSLHITVLCPGGGSRTIETGPDGASCRRETTTLAGINQYSAVCTEAGVTVRSNCWD